MEAERCSQRLRQTAYHIQVTSGTSDPFVVWDSGWVVSDQSHLVAYAGKQLLSSTPYFWRVRIKTETGLNRPGAEQDVKVEELKAVFKKQFNNELDVKNFNKVVLAINRWLRANNRGEYSGYWNGEEGNGGTVNAVYGVATIKPSSVLNVKVNELKAVFKKSFNGDLDVNNFRQVGLAVNRWLGVNRRGQYFGLWNGEQGKDAQGNAVYRIALMKQAGPDELVYVPNSTKKVNQLTGDTDRATGKPTLSQTGKRFGVEGAPGQTLHHAV